MMDDEHLTIPSECELCLSVPEIFLVKYMYGQEKNQVMSTLKIPTIICAIIG